MDTSRGLNVLTSLVTTINSVGALGASYRRRTLARFPIRLNRLRALL